MGMTYRKKGSRQEEKEGERKLRRKGRGKEGNAVWGAVKKRGRKNGELGRNMEDGKKRRKVKGRCGE